MKSYKTEINIHANPGLGKSSFEQPLPGFKPFTMTSSIKFQLFRAFPAQFPALFLGCTYKIGLALVRPIREFREQSGE